MLSRTLAYCLTCVQPRMFGDDMTDKFSDNGYRIRVGSCATCAAKMVRILPVGVVTPEADQINTENVYVTADAMTYVPGRYTGKGYGEEWIESRYTQRQGTMPVSGQRRVMQIGDILSTVAGSVDIYGQRADGLARWEAMLSNKAAAGHFDAVVDVLAREGMQMSIVLWDRYSNGSLHIGNGHHRLTAAILLGIEWMPVIVSTNGDYMRVDDSSDDEDRPIERCTDGERALWETMRDYMPVEADAEPEAARCDRCVNGCNRTACCGYRHAADCGLWVPEQPATATAERMAKRVQAEALNAAQRAAGDAVWALRMAAQQAMRDAQEKAARLRIEAEQADEEAEQQRIRFEALVPLYYRAAEIGQAQ